MTQETYQAPDSKKVLVTYYDDTTRETTVGELRKYFDTKNEDPEWVEQFFKNLNNRFEALGPYAKYQIILD